MANEITTQIVREAEPIETAKIDLMRAAAGIQMPTLPQFQVAGQQPLQTEATRLGAAGIGAYQPFLTAGTQGVAGGMRTIGEAGDILRASDTRNQFGAAQQALNQAAVPIQQMGGAAQLATQGYPLIGQGAAGLTAAQEAAGRYSQANLGLAQDYMRQSVGEMGAASPDFTSAQMLMGRGLGQTDIAAQQAQAAAAQPGFGQGIASLQAGAQQGAGAAIQPGFGQAQGAVQQGIGALSGAAQMYAPGQAQQFMNPYQQQVIDESLRQINRQGDISRQEMQAQAARSGAFGGSREGVQRAEMERGLAGQRNAAITGALSQGYQSAAQQAQQAFEAQQGRQLQQAQGLQSAGGVLGSLAGQQAGLGLQAAGMQQNVGQAQLAAAGQQGQLGMQAAGQQAAAGQMGLSASQQLSQQEAQRLAAEQTSAQYMGNIGQQFGQQALQQAQIGQGSAGLQGTLAGQTANLAGMYGNIAGQQANIYGQQAQLGQSLGQGIGALAGQQFGIGAQTAQGLGALGTQIGNLGVQQAALGQSGQQMGMADVNMLYNLGTEQQRAQQAKLDAERATSMQTSMQPLQKLAFMSDIYKGAPSTQMAMTQQSTPTPSPFQQIAGLATGIAGTAAAANRAGLI